MKKIDPDTIRVKWTGRPELAVVDSANYLDLTKYMADEINRRMDEIYKEHEIDMKGIDFKKLEKSLKPLGIELTTVRNSSGDIGCEIEGYFNPHIYSKYMYRKNLNDNKKSQPVRPKPKKVRFSGPATIILWEDGTKTVVKCQEEDVWSDEVGIGMCYLKKMLGNEGNFNNIFREAMKVAEVQYKKEELVSSTATEGESYYSSALENMSDNINQINTFMKDAAEALDKALGGKR